MGSSLKNGEHVIWLILFVSFICSDMQIKHYFWMCLPRMFPALAFESQDRVKGIAFPKADTIIQLTEDIDRTERSRKGGGG